MCDRHPHLPLAARELRPTSCWVEGKGGLGPTGAGQEEGCWFPHLCRPCGPQPTGSPHGTHTGPGLGAPGTCACSRHCPPHTGFSLWPGTQATREWRQRKRSGRAGRGDPGRLMTPAPVSCETLPRAASLLAQPGRGLLPRCGNPADTRGDPRPKDRVRFPPRTHQDMKGLHWSARGSCGIHRVGKKAQLDRGIHRKSDVTPALWAPQPCDFINPVTPGL